jgi:D-methionine transport system ATP-binding protein
MAIVEIKEVSKKFTTPTGHEHHALKDVSLQIEQGQILGIIGMSGAGKTTLMRCMVGLETPTSGEILFHGENIVAFTAAKKRAYRRRVGMVFQNFHLFASRTVAENIAYPLEIHGATSAYIQKRVV